MFNFFYDLVLFILVLIISPKVIWDWIFTGKYRKSLSARLGFYLPIIPSNKKVIWIHAVSVGETRAALPVFHLLKQEFPDVVFVISTTTQTGHAEARRCLLGAIHIYLPLDFSWVMRKVMRQIHPDILILSESDFWYQLLFQAKQRGAFVYLMNGKVSERSAKRFAFFSRFTQSLFSHIDHLCVQSQRHLERFHQMGIPQDKLSITGNLKLDVRPDKMNSLELESWKEKLGILTQDQVVVIGSTHHLEEEKILACLNILWNEFPQLKILLVPRHPERFADIANQLRSQNIDFSLYSKVVHPKSRVVLVDAMGLLNQCYQIAHVAIVAGSFVPHVGGHNIFEPLFFEVPVIFGPYMDDQLDLVDLVLTANVGRQVTLAQLSDTVASLLKDAHLRSTMAHQCRTLIDQIHGVARLTLDILLRELAKCR